MVKTSSIKKYFFNKNVSYHAVAEILGCSENTILRRLRAETISDYAAMEIIHAIDVVADTRKNPEIEALKKREG